MKNCYKSDNTNMMQSQSNQPANQPDEWTAYHEAGHCVVAVLLGGKVEWATITPDRDDGPNRWGDVRVKWQGRPRWVAQSLVYLAGPAAELVYRDESLHPAFVPEFASDWNSAWEASIASQKSDQDRLKLLERLSDELYQIIKRQDHWNAVAEIADLLLAHETIEYEEIHETVHRWIDG